MKKKNGNFNQAMLEMFGVGSDPTEEVAEEAVAEETAADEASAVTDVVPAGAYDAGG